MLAVGRDEVDQRLGVLDRQPEVEPVRVRRQGGVAVRQPEEVAAGAVQRRHARLTGPGHVQRGQVKRQTQQLVAQGLGDELVDLVTGLVGHPADDVAGRLLGRPSSGSANDRCGVGLRGEERIEQRDVILGAMRRGSGHRLGQHRVTEPVDRLRELGSDGRVDTGVVTGEKVDHRLHLASELLEGQVLVLHLGDEARCLEQPLAVPGAICQLPLPQHGGVLVGDDGLHVVGEAVVL